MNSSGAVIGGIFDSFFHYNFRPEVDTEVISSTTVDNFSLDVPLKFVDSMSNGFRDTQLVDFLSNERTPHKRFA